MATFYYAEHVDIAQIQTRTPSPDRDPLPRETPFSGQRPPPQTETLLPGHRPPSPDRDPPPRTETPLHRDSPREQNDTCQ